VNEFIHAQGSVYQCPDTTAANVWSVTCSLRTIEPPGVFASVLKALQMFYLPHPIMMLTNDLALGGQYSPGPIGPTPRNLIPDHVAAHPLDAAPDPLPRNVRRTQAALFGHNWAV
jgi:hypothetical protein